MRCGQVGLPICGLSEYANHVRDRPIDIRRQLTIADCDRNRFSGVVPEDLIAIHHRDPGRWQGIVP